MPRSAQPVARLSQLHESHATRVEVDGEKVLLVRAGSTVHAFTADCPHAGAPLEEGALCNGRIVCPWHKATFDASTGDLIEPPALFPLDRYPVTISGDDVLVSPDKIPPAAQPAQADSRHVAIVGAGAAGAAACAALREFGFAGRISLVGNETAPPYDRTALSKFVMSGEMKPDDVPPLLPDGFLERADIQRVVADVTRLDPRKRVVHLQDGRELEYDAALLAPGGKPIVPGLPGRHLSRVYLLRSLDDSRALMDGLPDHRRAVIIGSSFIGLEAASALRKRHVAVTITSPEKIPFAKQFCEEIGTMFQRLHEDNGVTFRLGTKVIALEGDEGAVHSVTLDSGAHLPADAVLIGTGVTPATDFVEGVTLEKDGAIAVDAGMQAAPGLYAAGDIVSFPLTKNGPHVRIEHWRVAQQHARIAARNMVDGFASNPSRAAPRQRSTTACRTFGLTTTESASNISGIHATGTMS
ncbi:FAD-dependent oxidoreductase [Paraburkholderia sp.]|uniref:FAD-dependent oxidoreductase n=1 Tax=Paraburkholderia sp. TaxID=1926495 RepID=UPI003437BFBD